MSLRAIPEVDFSKLVRGRRGRYADLLTGDQTHMVVIDRDLWPHFGSAAKVNDALRMLVALAKRSAAA